MRLRARLLSRSPRARLRRRRLLLLLLLLLLWESRLLSGVLLCPSLRSYVMRLDTLQGPSTRNASSSIASLDI